MSTTGTLNFPQSAQGEVSPANAQRVQGGVSTGKTLMSSVQYPTMIHGKSAYEIAVINGFVGTEEEWLESLKGDKPVKGIDYLTPDEMEALVNEIAEMLQGEIKSAKIGEVTLLASEWVGEDSLYSQVVNIEGVTENSQVDLTPNVQQLAVFHNKDITFVTENDGGVVTVYCIGQKPLLDYTIQVTITEVTV